MGMKRKHKPLPEILCNGVQPGKVGTGIFGPDFNEW
jgi:hypothetical protein